MFFKLLPLLFTMAFAQSTPSPNMSMPIPQVGVTPGPAWANNINSSLLILDAHDHTPGNGVQITPLAMNINSDLTCNANNLTNVRSTRYQAQGAPISGASDLGAVYVSGVDLYYNDENGNQVRITQGGAVTGATGSITNLTAPASASYVSGTKTFVWQSDVNTAANMDFRNATLRNSTASSFGLTLSPPPAMAADSTLVLPPLPASTSFVQLDHSGNITASIPVSAGLTTSNISPTAGIIGAQLSGTAGILGTQLTNNTIGLTQLATTVLQWNVNDVTAPVATFPVKAATTANGTLSTAFANGSIIDGVTLATNDVILIKNQTLTSDDGVYVVQASGAPVRSGSYDTFAKLNNALVSVSSGTTLLGSTWYQNNTLVSLVDPQSWSVSPNAQTWTVPANVNHIWIQGCGGGGGGGGSHGGTTNPPSGGGGAGAPIMMVDFPVTPSDTITISLGGGGLGGAGGASGGNGSNGLNGVLTSVTSTVLNLQLPGGALGAGGIGTTPGAGGSTVVTIAGYDYWNGNVPSTPGIAGSGAKNNATPGINADTSLYVKTAAVGGTSTGSNGAGGGGGGSGFGPGGAGGNGFLSGGGAASNNGQPGVNGCSGGGGGGAQQSGAAAAGRIGGVGAPGEVRIYWLGHS